MQVFGGFLLWFQRKNVNLQQNVERFNIKVMAATVLNSTQVHLLQMFQVDDSQKGLEELLYSYYSKKMQTSAMKACFQIAECSFSAAKIRNISLLCKFLGDFFCVFVRKD